MEKIYRIYVEGWTRYNQLIRASSMMLAAKKAMKTFKPTITIMQVGNQWLFKKITNEKVVRGDIHIISKKEIDERIEQGQFPKNWKFGKTYMYKITRA